MRYTEMLFLRFFSHIYFNYDSQRKVYLLQFGLNDRIHDFKWQFILAQISISIKFNFHFYEFHYAVHKDFTCAKITKI